jgi:hypothetical protein
VCERVFVRESVCERESVRERECVCVKERVREALSPHRALPLSSKLGAYKAVRAGFCTWLSGKSPLNLLTGEI